MSYYQRHVFFCTNMRQSGKKCCAQGRAENMREHAKARLKKLGVHGKDMSRINTSGCLGRCKEGPIIVIYPDNVWYTYHSIEDIDEIIDSHLINGDKVNRLLV